jgi:hypothetical protein
MRRQAIFLVPAILLTMVTACPPTVALAVRFSAPVRLPANEELWKFAVNDRGDAVGAYASKTGANVIELARSGHITHAWAVTAPDEEESGSVSISLSNDGDVALGLTYKDSKEKPLEEPHSGFGCCDRIAIATWRIGEQSPASAESVKLTSFHQVVRPVPLMLALGKGIVTALWTREDRVELEPGESKIEEAYGPIGGPLQSTELRTTRRGVTSIDLHEGTNGRPVASWVENEDVIRTAAGSPTGALPSPAGFQVVPKLRGRPGHEGGIEVGFTHDDEGDTVFAYLLPAKGGSQKLTTIVSRMAGRFSRPRAIASIPPKSGDVALYAGGRKSLLAIWDSERLHAPYEHFDALVDGVFEGFDTKTRLDESYSPNVASTAFIGFTGFQDSHARSVMIHEAPAVGHPHHFEMYAVSAQAHRPFGHPRRIAPGLRNCGLVTGAESGVESVANSSNGQAVVYLTCGEESGQEGSQYVVRYTP